MQIDDGTGCFQPHMSAENLSSEIQAGLIALGFILADEKCQWKPSQEIVWLGLVWDTEINKHRCQILEFRNFREIFKTFWNAMHQVFKWFEVLSIASVVVQIISIQIVFSDMINNLKSMNEKVLI